MSIPSLTQRPARSLQTWQKAEESSHKPDPLAVLDRVLKSGINQIRTLCTIYPDVPFIQHLLSFMALDVQYVSTEWAALRDTLERLHEENQALKERLSQVNALSEMNLRAAWETQLPAQAPPLKRRRVENAAAAAEPKGAPSDNKESSCINSLQVFVCNK